MDFKETITYRKESVVPEIDDSNVESGVEFSSKVKIRRLLDDIEIRVERYRKGALYMEEEKDCLITSIDALKSSDLINDLMENEKEEVLKTIERVSSRCGTVEVNVHTIRNEMQEESLYQVNMLINNLVQDLKCDPLLVKDRCMAYMAACGSKDDILDKNFESILLGCTLDDQKRIKKRLQGLSNYIDYNYEVFDDNDK